jgi:hypothetical protein
MIEVARITTSSCASSASEIGKLDLLDVIERMMNSVV